MLDEISVNNYEPVNIVQGQGQVQGQGRNINITHSTRLYMYKGIFDLNKMGELFAYEKTKR